MPHGWLFPGQHPMKPISTRQLHRVVVEAAQAADIAKRVPSSGTFVRLPAPETLHESRLSGSGGKNLGSRRSATDPGAVVREHQRSPESCRCCVGRNQTAPMAVIELRRLHRLTQACTREPVRNQV